MQRKATLSILAGGALWGCIGLFLKLLTAAGLAPMQGVAVRTTVAAVGYGLWLLVTDRKALRINPRHWYYFFGTGICSLLLFNWCYFNAIPASSMSVAAVLLYTAPVFVTLMSAALFHEKLTAPKLGALAVTFGGCVLVTGLFPLGQQGLSAKTILFGLGSGFGYALYSIIGKYALKKYSTATITFYTFLFASAASLPLSGLWKQPALLLDGRVVVGGLGIGVVCCILPYLLYTRGLQGTEASRAAILATIEPFVAAVIGIAFFHEEITVFKLLGMAAIFSAVLLLNRPAKHSAAA